MYSWEVNGTPLDVKDELLDHEMVAKQKNGDESKSLDESLPLESRDYEGLDENERDKMKAFELASATVASLLSTKYDRPSPEKGQ